VADRTLRTLDEDKLKIVVALHFSLTSGFSGDTRAGKQAQLLEGVARRAHPPSRVTALPGQGAVNHQGQAGSRR
jgi:hypothetical protein